MNVDHGFRALPALALTVATLAGPSPESLSAPAGDIPPCGATVSPPASPAEPRPGLRLVPIPDTRIIEALQQDLASGSFCDLLKEILACRLSELTNGKEEKDLAARKVKALQDIVLAHRDDAAFPKEAMAKVLEELAARKKAKQAADEAYTDEDEAARLVLVERADYVGRFCEQRGWPEAFYSAHVGAEGAFDESSIGLKNGSLQANLFFATPLIYVGTPNAKVKLLGTERKLLCSDRDGRLALKPFTDLSPSDDKRYLLAGFSRGGRLHFDRSPCAKPPAPCLSSFAALLAEREAALKSKHEMEGASAAVKVETLRSAVAEAQQDAQKKAETVARLSAVVTYFLGSLPDTGCPGGQPRPDWPPVCRQLQRAQLDFKDAETALRNAKATLDDREKKLARETKNVADAEGARSLCEALGEIDALITALDRLDMGEWRSRSAYRRDRSLEDPPRQVRVGPFRIPDPVKLQTAPIWAFVKVGTERIANLTAKQQADVTRLTTSIGAYYSWTLNDYLVIGPALSAGAVFGSLPRSSTDESAPFRNQLFYDLGVLLQSRYRVADVDKAAGIKGVFGQFYAGYRRANYLKDQSSDDGLGFGREADRLLLDLRLSFGEAASRTVRPFVYATVDKSLRGQAHRDRVGVMLEVDLKTLFKGSVDSATATVKNVFRPAVAGSTEEEVSEPGD